MKLQQLFRHDKIYKETFFLLNKAKLDYKLTFDISGSTTNIYRVQIYLNNRKIYCNCPDSKKWAKCYNVVCKHICFLLIKVFKLNILNLNYFFENLIFNDENIESINNEYNKIDFTNKNYINQTYLDKYKNMTKNNVNTIILKDDQLDEIDCCICFDIINDLTNIKINKQCKTCLIIIHKECVNKWFNMGNNNCPHCRTIMTTDNAYYKNLL
jgi:hypothetical protein